MPRANQYPDIVNNARSGEDRNPNGEKEKNKEYACPTCTYLGTQENHLQKHRRRKQACQPQWGKEQHQGQWACKE